MFDDYMFSIEKSDWWSKAPEMQDKSEEFRKESHVERLITLVVSQHPDIEEVIIRNNWVWARKKADAGMESGPKVTHLTKTIIKRWFFDAIGRK